MIRPSVVTPIDASGAVFGQPAHGFNGVLTGVPLVRAEGARTPPRLTPDEAMLLEQIQELGEASARALS